MDDVYAPGKVAVADDGPPEQAILLYLRQTQPWLWLFAILFGFGSFLMVVVGLGFAVVSGFAGDLFGEGGPRWLGPAVGAMYVVFGAVYGVPVYFLVRAALASRAGDLAGAATAVRHQRNFWRAMGAMFLAMIVLYCGGVSLIGVFGAFSAGSSTP